MEDKLLVLADISDKHGLSLSTLRRAIRLGHLQATQFGKTYAVAESALKEWLDNGGYHPKMARKNRQKSKLTP